MPNAVETNNHMTMLLFLTYKITKKSKYKLLVHKSFHPSPSIVESLLYFLLVVDGIVSFS
jgi:hypothetical protein